MQSLAVSVECLLALTSATGAFLSQDQGRPLCLLLHERLPSLDVEWRSKTFPLVFDLSEGVSNFRGSGFSLQCSCLGLNN
ncbi:hypothetical protein EDD86DRAFT_214979 [Gorgonomyces haynaldii]|nr:hypothetical protein EDD86DRAFT_214979 [Gorgonomyces haynaldii]